MGEHWPYDVSQFTVKPTEGCYTEATKNTAMEYARVPQTLEDIKGVLNEGFPFAFGFTVLSSFFTEEVSSTGYMPMPQDTDYFYMPYDYICHPYLASDLWAIKFVDGADFPTVTKKL